MAQCMLVYIAWKVKKEPGITINAQGVFLHPDHLPGLQPCTTNYPPQKIEISRKQNNFALCLRPPIKSYPSKSS